MSQLKADYFHHHLDTYFVTRSMWYRMYMPIWKSGYDKLKQTCSDQTMSMESNTFMIEKAAMIGLGWIGFAHADGSKHVVGDFIGYEIVGDYKQMKSAYQKILKDYPKACNFYNIYWTDPSVTPMEENKTWILFQG